MQCPRCQHENLARAKFCEECATPLVRPCAHCGSQISPTAKFCPECAHPVGLGIAQPRFGSLESYTPKHLAEKILTSRSALEGERKQVTVLFADMKGSMELLADRDPEDARKILDPVLERMMEAVHYYEGTVNQVMGDGIMALFGAPVAHEDHAVRACYAALRMQESVRRYAGEARHSHGINLQIRVGLNSGEVVVRAIGSDLHMDYTAVGKTTHLAARLEQFASPGTVLLAPETLRLAEGYIEVQKLGPVPMKGLGEPVQVYEVRGASLARTRIQASATRGLTRFVGRDAELEQLCRALQLAGGSHGQVAAVVGEPGVGKSRFFYEFIHSHRTQGWLILESGSVSYGKATSYLPVIDLLQGYFKIQDRDDHRDIREKVIGKLLALDRTLEPTLPVYLALLDVPFDDAEWRALDPPQRRQRILDAIKRLLLRESEVQPLVLIFEDLHWIDTETQSLLDSLIESLPRARVLVLVNYRPEYQHDWGSKTYYTQLRLDALPPDSASELLHALLGDDAALEPLKQVLITRTEGNPFFLEESIRTLIETKALVGERGSYRLAHTLETIQVPATIQAMLAARIDRLPAEDKQLLQSAAVIGKDVPYTLLLAIAEVPEGELRRGLTHLQTAEFLYETRLFPDAEYTFKHTLTHEVAYAILLNDRRRALHARIAEEIETLFAVRLAEHVERLAQHALRGEVWGKAAQYLRQAGAKAVDRSANHEAVVHFEQALVALQHLPESPHTIEQAIDLRLDLRNPLAALGEFERVFGYLRETQRLAEALGDQRRLGWVFGYLAVYFSGMGDPDRALESGKHALAIAEAAGDLGIHVVANTGIFVAYEWLDDYPSAIAFERRNVELLEGEPVEKRFGLAGLPAVICRAYLALSLAEVGQFGEGIAFGEEGLHIARAVNHPYSQIFADYFVGALYVEKGDFDRAIRLLEHGLTLGQAVGIRIYFPVIASTLGLAFAMSGRLAEAFPLLEQGAEAGNSKNPPAYRPYEMGALSEAYVIAGRPDEAAELAQAALDLSRSLKQRGHEARMLRLLGESYSHRDLCKVEKAEEFYRQAMVLATETGMRPLVAHCHLGFGRLYWRTGRREQAHEHLTTATTMYREMGMAFWLAKGEAALKELT